MLQQSLSLIYGIRIAQNSVNSQIGVRVHRDTVNVSWSKPSPRWIKINTHGSVKHFTLHVVVGGLIRCSNGRWLKGFARNLGLCSITNGALDGLMAAVELGASNVILEMDILAAVQILNSGHAKGYNVPLVNTIT